MDFELYVRAHLAELHRRADSAWLVHAARQTVRDDTRPGRFERLVTWLLDRTAWPVPPANQNSDPWYPWWWDG